ncbi:MAG: hypothetical protein Q8R79_08060 [Legionellaceae bacterium]|nr:hypothetical protein [Legionellaceae bacterium]
MSIGGHAAQPLPNHCTPIVIEGEFLSFDTQKPGVFLLHNISNYQVWLTRVNTHEEQQSSELSPDKWTTIVIKDRKLEYQCIESSPGHEQEMPCQLMLMACQWSKGSIPSTVTHSMLALENETLAQTRSILGSRGFHLDVQQSKA